MSLSFLFVFGKYFLQIFILISTNTFSDIEKNNEKICRKNPLQISLDEDLMNQLIQYHNLLSMFFVHRRIINHELPALILSEIIL